MVGKLHSLAVAAMVCLLVQRISLSRAFYIPGVAPTEYNDGQKLEIKVKKAFLVVHWPIVCKISLKHQLRAIIVN